jgi:hypothetical protein
MSPLFRAAGPIVLRVALAWTIVTALLRSRRHS